jgi:hypothetical protein
MGELQSISKNI